MQTAVGPSRNERRKQGKALRVKVPRTAHAEWKPRPKSQDIVKLIEESDVGRIRGLLPVKYQRMAVSPFTFFRGAAIIQARDLANAPVSGITVQACGDCHLTNFGGFASPERSLVFDINDFDETFPVHGNGTSSDWGPAWCWRRGIGRFSKAVANQAVRAAAASYREQMSEFAEMTVLGRMVCDKSSGHRISEYFRKDQDFSARLRKKQKSGPVRDLRGRRSQANGGRKRTPQDQRQSAGPLPFSTKMSKISKRDT